MLIRAREWKIEFYKDFFGALQFIKPLKSPLKKSVIQTRWRSRLIWAGWIRKQPQISNKPRDIGVISGPQDRYWSCK